MSSTKNFSINKKTLRTFLRSLAVSNDIDRYFVTLTFASPIGDQLAGDIFRRFHIALSKAVFGSRSSKRIKCIPMLEQNYNNGCHFHIFFEDPYERILHETRKGRINFRTTVKRCWESTRGPTGRIYEACPDRTSWFKDITSIDGVIDYMTKQLRFKEDVIQWDLCETKGRSKPLLDKSR